MIRTKTNRTLRLARLLFIAILSFSSLAKAWAPETFAGTLSAWRTVPDWAVGFVMIGVCLTEFHLAMTWLRGDLGPAIRQTGIFLLVITTAFTLEALLFTPPACNCFGKLLQAFEGQDMLIYLLIRNSAMIGLIAMSATILHRGQLYE